MMCSIMPLTSTPLCTPAAEVDKRREQEAAAKKQDTAAANEINTTPGAEQGTGFRDTWQPAPAALREALCRMPLCSCLHLVELAAGPVCACCCTLASFLAAALPAHTVLHCLLLSLPISAHLLNHAAAGEKYHVICSLGSGVYTEWQSRVVGGTALLCCTALQYSVPVPAGMHATFCRRAPRAPDCDQLQLPACRSQQMGVDANARLAASALRVGLQSYYWYKKTREKCIAEQGDACPMGGYTRLLHRCAAVLAWCRRDGNGSGQCLATHLPAAWTGAAHLQPQCLAFLFHPACNAALLHCSGKPDKWMDEIPTVVVDSLPPDLAAVAAVGAGLGRPSVWWFSLQRALWRCFVCAPCAHPLHARRSLTLQAAKCTVCAAPADGWHLPSASPLRAMLCLSGRMRSSSGQRSIWTPSQVGGCSVGMPAPGHEWRRSGDNQRPATACIDLQPALLCNRKGCPMLPTCLVCRKLHLDGRGAGGALRATCVSCKPAVILQTGSQPAFHLGCGGSCMLARQPHRRNPGVSVKACQPSIVS